MNVADRQIEVYADPAPAARVYDTLAVYGLGQSVPVRIAGDVVGTIPVDAVFP